MEKNNKQIAYIEGLKDEIHLGRIYLGWLTKGFMDLSIKCRKFKSIKVCTVC